MANLGISAPGLMDMSRVVQQGLHLPTQATQATKVCVWRIRAKGLQFREGLGPSFGFRVSGLGFRV